MIIGLGSETGEARIGGHTGEARIGGPMEEARIGGPMEEARIGAKDPEGTEEIGVDPALIDGSSEETGRDPEEATG